MVLKIYISTFIAASPMPGLVIVILESQNGEVLAKTEVMYYEYGMRKMAQKIVTEPDLQKLYFIYYYNDNTGTSEGETQNSGSLGRLIL